MNTIINFLCDFFRPKAKPTSKLGPVKVKHVCIAVLHAKLVSSLESCSWFSSLSMFACHLRGKDFCYFILTVNIKVNFPFLMFSISEMRNFVQYNEIAHCINEKIRTYIRNCLSFFKHCKLE